MGLLRSTEALRAALIGAGPSNTPQAGVVTSAFQFITTGEDNLRVRSWCSVAGVTVGIQGRHASADGPIVPFGFVHAPLSTRLVREDFYALAPGAILNVSASILTGSVTRGECFIELALVRGLTGATYFLGTLLQGYIGTVGALAWPGSPIEHPTDGRGAIKNSGFVMTAVGELEIPVPTNALWKVLLVSARLTTFPVPGTRIPILCYDDGALIYMRSPQKETIGSGDSKAFNWLPGLPHETVLFNGIGVAGLPEPSLLPAGHRIRTVTSGLQAFEGYEEVTVMIEEWIRP